VSDWDARLRLAVESGGAGGRPLTWPGHTPGQKAMVIRADDPEKVEKRRRAQELGIVVYGYEPNPVRLVVRCASCNKRLADVAMTRYGHVLRHRFPLPYEPRTHALTGGHGHLDNSQDHWMLVEPDGGPKRIDVGCRRCGYGKLSLSEAAAALESGRPYISVEVRPSD